MNRSSSIIKLQLSISFIKIFTGKKSLVLTSLILFCNFISWGQYNVTATVIDEENNPEEYVTFRVFEIPDTTHQILGNVTGPDGIIDTSLPKAGNYKIVISAMMKLPITIDFTIDDSQPIANLGIINTQLSGETLNEITVTAQRPLVTKEIDRIGYDVQADGDASTSNLREILKKVPLVSVDAEGNIKVNGSDNFKVYRNGRPNNAFTKNSKDIFAAIPASTIKKIEIITDPGAREDAESSGVILNIVTTTTVSMAGVTGSVGVNYRSDFGPQANAFIMTQFKKLTFSASGGFYSYLWRNNFSEERSKILFAETDDTEESNSKYGIGNRGGWANLEGSLELDTLNLITTAITAYKNKNSCKIHTNYSLFNHSGNEIYSYDQDSYYRKYGYTDIDFNLDYQRLTRLKGETITLSYRLSHTRQDQDQTTDYTILTGNPFNYTSNISDFDLKFFEHTFQLDWSRPFGNHYKLDTGAKYILRSSHSVNNQTLVGVSDTYDDFKHTYNIFAVYADARASYGIFSARAGVRYEYSRLYSDFITGDEEGFGASLNDVVPNASIALKIGESSMWKLSYNRRIQRPGISYLDPAVTVNPNSVTFGNPDLKSSTLDNILMNYSYSKNKFYLDLTLFYNFTNNGMGPVQWTDENNITYSTYDNTTHMRQITLSAFFQWQIAEKTSLMFNGNFGWNKYSLVYGNDKVRLARPEGYFYTNLQQKLPGDFTMSININYFSGNCSSPFVYSKNAASFIGYSIGLKKSFLKDKRLDVNISLNNIGIKSRKRSIYYLNNGRTGSKTDNQYNNQGVSIGVSWRFGNLRAQVKKTDKSISNDDLQGRKN